MNNSKEYELNLAVNYGKLKKIMKILEDKNFTDKDMVSFEFLVGSCFPTVLENIKNRIRQAYTQGYVDKQNEDSKEEKTRLN